jgi:hypothetical protein
MADGDVARMVVTGRHATHGHVCELLRKASSPSARNGNIAVVLTTRHARERHAQGGVAGIHVEIGLVVRMVRHGSNCAKALSVKVDVACLGVLEKQVLMSRERRLGVREQTHNGLRASS